MVHFRVTVLNIMLSFIFKINSTKGSIEIRNAGNSGSVHPTRNHQLLPINQLFVLTLGTYFLRFRQS